MKSETKLCPCCMENHDIQMITVKENNIYKGVPVEYEAKYFYCNEAGETYADEQQISSNDIAMKNAYREKTGLLTASQIEAIRIKYGISQSDLCLLLGWGGKTITRYESHQVQDIAHDTILRKLNSDPEWFLKLLYETKDFLPSSSYKKYLKTGTVLFEQNHDLYLKSAIMATYAKYLHNPEVTGGKVISLKVVIDMIRYYANSLNVTNLFLVKLMKMLWYADALSYKKYGHAISGLIYRALPMGAVPIAYKSIIDLNAISFEEIDINDGIGYRFLPTENKEYPHLSSEDKATLETVIRRFGKASTKEIVEAMHKEDAYTQTAPNDLIQFKYSKTLSLY